MVFWLALPAPPPSWITVDFQHTPPPFSQNKLSTWYIDGPLTHFCSGNFFTPLFLSAPQIWVPKSQRDDFLRGVKKEGSWQSRAERAVRVVKKKHSKSTLGKGCKARVEVNKRIKPDWFLFLFSIFFTPTHFTPLHLQPLRNYKSAIYLVTSKTPVLIHYWKGSY